MGHNTGSITERLHDEMRDAIWNQTRWQVERDFYDGELTHEFIAAYPEIIEALLPILARKPLGHLELSIRNDGNAIKAWYALPDQVEAFFDAQTNKRLGWD